MNKKKGVVMSIHLSPWGPFYAEAPVLQRAINHAERLTELLKDTRPNDEDEDAASWLVGRVDEMQVFVELILQRWRYEGLSEAGAAAAITAYLDTLHHGLARYFCDLAPRCCEDALLTTVVPFGMQTTEMTAFREDGRMTAIDATVIDVDPAELFAAITPAPSTPVSPV
jgi:hypothetical protein